MTTLTIKNLPDDLYARLQQSAQAHRRSLNREVMVLLESALGAPAIDVDNTLARLDALRRRLHLPPLTERKLRAAKARGRP